ncbi:MAG: TM0106 family RecB-like putative nuclease [Acidimicrobiia bacterium]
MQLVDGALVLSPSDLTGFAACTHLTQLDLAAASGELEPPSGRDPEVEVIARHGDAHERRVLAMLRAERSRVVAIEYPEASRAALGRAEAATLAAMRGGADVIYQATFFDGCWRGHADFLLRVEEPSDLGHWSYEVADAKLARRVKSAALLQMCSYSRHVERLQGRAPQHMHVFAGDLERHPFRVADYAAYFRTLAARYEPLVLGGPADGHDGYPNPVEHCGLCRWAERCAQRRHLDDHLSIVAGMRRGQTRRLEAQGITTRRALARLAPGTHVPGIGAATSERLRRQAALQVETTDTGRLGYDFVEPAAEPGELPRGFASLPEPSPGDLFFDMEGDPFAFDCGLEYLFGVVELRGRPARSQYHAFWAHDRAQEKLAFEAFIDFVMERVVRHPKMHVYHYAPYEPSAVKRLMGMHGTREEEVDRLLRGGMFVDLYRVLRQSLVVSTESYSLKEIEHFYMAPRAGDVTSGSSSIVAYEEFVESGDESVLASIESYNGEDCESTRLLRDWLEARRAEAETQFGVIARPMSADDGGEAPEQLAEREATLAEREATLAELADELCAGVLEDDEERDAERQARWLLAQLLHWHRREAKPEWWAYYERRDHFTEADFVNDPECIGGLSFVRDAQRIKQSVVHEYAFEPQDYKFDVGDQPVDPATGNGAGTVWFVDDLAGSIGLKRSVRSTAPHPSALMPPKPRGTREQEDAIAEVAAWVVDHGIGGAGRHRAARDLLLRRGPRLRGARAGSPVRREGERPLDAARRAVLELHDACFAIQGPPGSGKTFTGAQMIVDLLAAGKRVGVTANGHAAIGQLLRKVCDAAGREGVDVRGLQKCAEHQHCGEDVVPWTSDNGRMADAVAGRTANLLAGTPWLWSRPEMRGALDVLFVDEAGQMSLANAVAVSPAARSLVLLGDPQQLAQPSKGSHPPGAEASALAHLLGDDETMPADRGLFLDATFRMHPDVCTFVSDVAYEGRLHAEPGLERQRLTGVGDPRLVGAGLRYVPVQHEGDRIRSDEEASVVAELVHALVGGRWTGVDGRSRRIRVHDIVVVAPYNAHVACLSRALPEGARVGTVDKFQGQEAPIAIYSMATSSADDLTRTVEFLYDLHRFNVAVSRARALSILVCSPELLRVHCRTPEQLRLANALSRYVELAGP